MGAGALHFFDNLALESSPFNRVEILNHYGLEMRTMNRLMRPILFLNILFFSVAMQSPRDFSDAELVKSIVEVLKSSEVNVVQGVDAGFNQYTQRLIDDPALFSLFQQGENEKLRSQFDGYFENHLQKIAGSACDADVKSEEYRFCTNARIFWGSLRLNPKLKVSPAARVIALRMAAMFQGDAQTKAFLEEFSPTNKETNDFESKNGLTKSGRVLGMGIKIQEETAYFIFTIVNAYKGGPRENKKTAPVEQPPSSRGRRATVLKTEQPAPLPEAAKAQPAEELTPQSAELPKTFNPISLKDQVSFNKATQSNPSGTVFIAFRQRKCGLTESFERSLRAYSTYLSDEARASFYIYDTDADGRDSVQDYIPIIQNNYHPLYWGAPPQWKSTTDFPVLMVYKNGKLIDSFSGWIELDQPSKIGDLLTTLSQLWKIQLKRQIRW